MTVRLKVHVILQKSLVMMGETLQFFYYYLVTLNKLTILNIIDRHKLLAF